MSVTQARPAVPKGLDGVIVAETAVSDVNGTEGWYHYRGIEPTRIARTASFEDAWYLLHHGDLPSPEQRDAFRRELRAAMVLPPVLRDALPAMAALGPAGSMDVLRTAVSAAGVAVGCAPWTEQDRATTEQQALRVAAMTSVLAAGLYRLARGLGTIEPRDDLSLAANYLWMLSGDVPDAALARALDTYLVLAADHGFCNSTFAERVIVSSGADVGGALSGAVGALSGPLHGGAIGRVPSMLDAIGAKDAARTWLSGRLERGERLMGFGHAVYRTLDPRTTVLREVARDIASKTGDERIELAFHVEQVGIELLNARKPEKRREANVDFYAGVVLGASGVPEELFGSTFAVARMAGWTANLLEQIDGNRIFRPSAHYVGPPRR